MPIVRVNDKLILFIHVPKTGGTSVDAYLKKHAPLSFFGDVQGASFSCPLQHCHGDLLRNLFDGSAFDWSFMVVRHPLKRLLSEYRYKTRKPHWIRNRMSFSVWLRYAFRRWRKDPYYCNNHFRPQHEFEAFGAEVFRLEDGLDAPIARLNEVLGIESSESAPWSNKTASREIEVTSADREMIFRAYQDDFERYGYEM